MQFQHSKSGGARAKQDLSTRRLKGRTFWRIFKFSKFKLQTSVTLQVGDGTTTVVILAGEFLREAKTFVEEGVHPQSIMRSYREAATLATQRLKEVAVDVGGKSAAETRDLLVKCASTSLNSKLVRLYVRWSKT